LPALKSASRAVSPRNPLPVLTGLKLAAQDGSLVVTGTDLEIGIACTVPAQVEEPGSVVLPAGVLVNLVDKLPLEEITVLAKNGLVTFKYGSSTAVLNGFSADEYPEVASEENKASFNVKSRDLCDLLSRTIYAVCDDTAKAILCGVYFELTGGELILVGTDTHRLSLGTLTLDGVMQEKAVIVPKKAAEEVIRLFRSTDNLAVVMGDSQIVFASENITLTSRLIGGKYPNYRGVLPKDFVARARVKPSSLINSLERASVLADNIPVMLQVKEGFIEISLENERGSLRECVEAAVDGVLKIYFSVDYLIDAVKNVAADDRDVQIGFTGPLSPAMVRAAGGRNVISIIMPRQVAENIQDKKAS